MRIMEKGIAFIGKPAMNSGVQRYYFSSLMKHAEANLIDNQSAILYSHLYTRPRPLKYFKDNLGHNSHDKRNL